MAGRVPPPASGFFSREIVRPRVGTASMIAQDGAVGDVVSPGPRAVDRMRQAAGNLRQTPLNCT
jgi:hypothetical protein